MNNIIYNIFRFNLEDGDKQSQGSSLERSNRSAMNRSYQREHLDEPDELMERPNHLNRYLLL